MSAIDRNPPDISLALLGSVFLVGILGDVLIGDAPRGIAFVLWILLIVGMAFILLRRARREMSRETAFWLLAAVVFSAGIAWRDAIAIQLFDFMAAFFALVMAVASCRHGKSLIFASRLYEITNAFISVGINMLLGLSSFFMGLKANHVTKSKQRSMVRVLVAVSIAMIVFVVFFALLHSADPIFASFATLPAMDFANLIRHIALIFLFTWTIGGAALAALNPKYREDVSLPWPLQIDRLEIGLVLGILNLLFATFVIVQLGWFFGGEQFLQEKTGLGVAEYARHGFFQMVFVVALAVPLLLLSRALLVPSTAAQRLHTALALPIVGLLSMMIVSSATKLRLYISYYGLSTDRLYSLIFMTWLGLVLIWLAFTVLRNRSHLFPSGVMISAMATLVLLNIFVPDRIVANINVARATLALPFDITYLANLSADAVETSVNALLTWSPTTTTQQKERCKAATLLRERFGLSQTNQMQSINNSWRFFNAADAKARRIVNAHSEQLGRMCHQQDVTSVNNSAAKTL